MKSFFLICLLFISYGASGICLPDSPGSKYNSNDEIIFLENIAHDIQESYNPLLADKELVIVFQSLNSRINAEINKKGNQLVLELFGGMLSHPKMNENSFRMLLCHELGHAFGGPPLKSKAGWSSTEGQADYYSGLYCARLLGMDETSFIEGALDLTSIYAEVMREPVPKLDQCDEKKVERTNFGYPSVQCRLQTILAGWKEEPRPGCWFKP